MKISLSIIYGLNYKISQSQDIDDVFNIFFEIHVPKKASWLLNLSTYTVNQHFSHSKQCSNIFQYEAVLEGLCYCSRFKNLEKKLSWKRILLWTSFSLVNPKWTYRECHSVVHYCTFHFWYTTIILGGVWGGWRGVPWVPAHLS